MKKLKWLDLPESSTWMGEENKRAYLIAILRNSGEFLITFALSTILFGLMFGLWEEWRNPFAGNLALLIPIVYVMSREVMSLHRVYQQAADLIQGPRTLVGYITLHDSQTIWHRERIGRYRYATRPIRQRYMINIVPADAFARWLGKPEWEIKQEASEAEYRYDPDTAALSTEVLETENEASRNAWLQANNVYPITLEAPKWAFDMVRLGDLIRLTYARRTGRIYKIEIMLSVMMPE